jgi:hypothetical protein
LGSLIIVPFTGRYARKMAAAGKPVPEERYRRAFH